METKEAPARGVRAVMGRLFGGKGKARPSADKAKATAPDAGHVKVIETEAPAAEAVVTEAAAPEAAATKTEAAPETVAPATETAAPESVAGPETAAPEAAAADVVLPLANYDTLTVASLRARLRTLSVDDLVVLISYEKAHEGREDVVGMFERRKAKIIAGETSSFQAVK
ncbi:MAG TPA: hypothetical protein VMG38_18215 [Trebonia sp.]|nr:hypothetical protein [Trebonia sp.]